MPERTTAIRPYVEIRRVLGTIPKRQLKDWSGMFTVADRIVTALGKKGISVSTEQVRFIWAYPDKTTTIMPDDILQDPLDDEVGLLIRDVVSGGSWDKGRYAKRDKLFQKLKALKYHSFSGHFQQYHLQRVGQSFLYHVPLTKKGVLERFRGKLIRIICVGKDRCQVSLMAKEYKTLSVKQAANGNKVAESVGVHIQKVAKACVIVMRRKESVRETKEPK